MGIEKLRNHADIIGQLYAYANDKYGADLARQTNHVKALALVSIAESLAELTAIIKKADEDDETR